MGDLNVAKDIKTGENAPGILDAVSHSRQNKALQSLNPQRLVLDLLKKLDDRGSEILTLRYGLVSGLSDTLERIGQKFGLTRERVRQIEKESVKKLRKAPPISALTELVDLIRQILEENDSVSSQSKILDVLLPNRTRVAEQAVLFILDLIPDFKHLKENANYNTSWYLEGFDRDRFDKLVDEAVSKFVDWKQVAKIDELFQKLDSEVSSSEALENILSVSKKIGKNIYDEWGLPKWPEINPRDVGDKAYLVLKHSEKPEHYEEITNLINKQKFDNKTAHKETVHNELIKDKRFVLVGRGIYALKQWGYKSGTVADIITNIIKEAGKPLKKSEIIEKVLKQRMVKKNTIVVGLSNKKMFKKLSDGKYTFVETNIETSKTD
jgi:DNA-directed RNA polymerase delta subunit